MCFFCVCFCFMLRYLTKLLCWLNLLLRFSHHSHEAHTLRARIKTSMMDGFSKFISQNRKHSFNWPTTNKTRGRWRQQEGKAYTAVVVYRRRGGCMNVHWEDMHARNTTKKKLIPRSTLHTQIRFPFCFANGLRTARSGDVWLGERHRNKKDAHTTPIMRHPIRFSWCIIIYLYVYVIM